MSEYVYAVYESYSKAEVQRALVEKHVPTGVVCKRTGLAFGCRVRLPIGSYHATPAEAVEAWRLARHAYANELRASADTIDELLKVEPSLEWDVAP